MQRRSWPFSPWAFWQWGRLLPRRGSRIGQEAPESVASLISVPLQSNWDFSIGPAHAMRYLLNVQTVALIGVCVSR